ncbi:MAG: PqqD family peptide modification chaperone [Methylobacter sp.]|nr:PqqD family peptide modification chaperone [Methylococcales bacterium]MDD5112531.1 PqqD family peptide modification chaperone [Methylobacter sp.]
MTQISLTSTVCQSEGHVSAVLDEEVVLMSIEKGAYFGLNRVLSCIWQILETPTTVSQLCAILQDEYDVEPEVCKRDVFEALEKLAENKLITVY